MSPCHCLSGAALEFRACSARAGHPDLRISYRAATRIAVCLQQTGQNLVLCDGDNDLSFVLSGAISTKRFADLGEAVGPIDHRHKFARLEEFAQIGQALIGLQLHNTEILLAQPANLGSWQYNLQRA